MADSKKRQKFDQNNSTIIKPIVQNECFKLKTIGPFIQVKIDMS